MGMSTVVTVDMAPGHSGDPFFSSPFSVNHRIIMIYSTCSCCCLVFKIYIPSENFPFLNRKRNYDSSRIVFTTPIQLNYDQGKIMAKSLSKLTVITSILCGGEFIPIFFILLFCLVEKLKFLPT